MRKIRISPSIMCMDFMNVKERLDIIDKHFDLYHMDIMDGHFCPNIALSPDFVNQVRKNGKLPMDVHLMCEQPDIWINTLSLNEGDCISVQSETVIKNAFRICNMIKDKGLKFGVVLSPSVPLSSIEYYLSRVDILTIMSVDTGFAGQKFITEMIDKIRTAVELRKKKNYHYEIQIDGSCNENSYKQLYDAGIDIFIVGPSGLYSLDKDLETAIQIMKDKFYSTTGERL